MAFPDRSDLPARTMLTSEGSVSRSTHVVADPRTQRLHTLTPIECERLNGFPDDWTVGMPERLRYLTIGNALVVPLVTAIGKPDQRTGRGRAAQLMGVSLGFPKGCGSRQWRPQNALHFEAPDRADRREAASLWHTDFACKV